MDDPEKRDDLEDTKEFDVLEELGEAGKLRAKWGKPQRVRHTPARELREDRAGRRQQAEKKQDPKEVARGCAALLLLVAAGFLCVNPGDGEAGSTEPEAVQEYTPWPSALERELPGDEGTALSLAKGLIRAQLLNPGSAKFKGGMAGYGVLDVSNFAYDFYTVFGFVEADDSQGERAFAWVKCILFHRPPELRVAGVPPARPEELLDHPSGWWELHSPLEFEMRLPAGAMIFRPTAE